MARRELTSLVPGLDPRLVDHRAIRWSSSERIETPQATFGSAPQTRLRGLDTRLAARAATRPPEWCGGPLRASPDHRIWAARFQATRTHTQPTTSAAPITTAAQINTPPIPVFAGYVR